MYHPDKWTIIDYGDEWNEDRYAIIAGWGGSFTWGASWKRSSPIQSVGIVTGKQIGRAHV